MSAAGNGRRNVIVNGNLITWTEVFDEPMGFVDLPVSSSGITRTTVTATATESPKPGTAEWRALVDALLG